MNIRLSGLLLLLVILGSVIAVPAFAQTFNSANNTNRVTSLNNTGPSSVLRAYQIANMTTSSTTAPVTVATDKSSYNSGDTVKISGTTANYLGDTPLTLEVRSPVGNLVHADQITVTSDKTFSASMVATGALWTAAGTYTVDVYYGNNNATATFQFSGSTVAPTGPSTIPVDGTSYSISYTITNGKVLDIKADPASKSLTVSIQTTGNGLLTITMPRALIDAKNPDGTDAKFVVLNDGQENTNATETMPAGATTRTLAIPFNNGTQQIEIIGTFVIPEFGPIAVMVLAIAVVSIIAISKKTGLRFSPRY